MARKYLVNLAIALDEFGNAFAGGDPRETISSRAAKARMQGRKWAYWLCAFLNIFQVHHCIKTEDNSVGDDGIIKD